MAWDFACVCFCINSVIDSSSGCRNSVGVLVHKKENSVVQTDWDNLLRKSPTRISLTITIGTPNRKFVCYSGRVIKGRLFGCGRHDCILRLLHPGLY